MVYKIGSARSDERGKFSGGKPGDQKQTTDPDYKGEVSIQDFYVHSKGWIVIRHPDPKIRQKIGNRMIVACRNKHCGYSQGDRYGIIKHGIDTIEDCNGDCSSYVRECVKEGTGKDPGDFNTASEVSVLRKAGFEIIEYKAGMKLYKGDILVTKTKGHTVIVTEGEPEKQRQDKTYPKYKGSSLSIVDALQAVGETDTTLKHRKKIAAANNISAYTGSPTQNGKLLGLLKAGKLIKA